MTHSPYPGGLPRLRQLPEFDAVVVRFTGQRLSFSEAEALEESHWKMGEDGWLREDYRFRETPGGRWMLAGGYLANDWLHARLVEGRAETLLLSEALDELEQTTRRPCVFCDGDERLVREGDSVRLAASELSDRPLIETEISDEAKFSTHLPIHTLKATAASLPSGDWGSAAQEQQIETLGWLRVNLEGRTPNPRMFVAQIQGHSMDDGRSGLVHRGWAVFELWPGAGWDEQVMLVRGSFTAPETGTYAVKKYVGVEPDQSGRFAKVRLQSLNPDRKRFPEIVIEHNDEGQVTVVARLIKALRGRQYARAPKPAPTPGRRNIADPEVQARRVDGLRHRMSRFFEGRAQSESGAPETAEQPLARLVCLDEAAKGLHLFTTPPSYLPPMVRRMTFAVLVDGGEVARVLGANLLGAPQRVRVTPTTVGYRWSVPGREEISEADLAPLAADGLNADRATVFRVDAQGVGQRLSGTTLSSSSTYRIVLGAQHRLATAPVGTLWALDPTWSVWELTVPAKADEETREVLRQIGLELGSSAPEMTFAIRPPRAWRQSPGGEAFPVFASDEPPIVHIQSPSLVRVGELALVLTGPFDSTTTMLPPGESWTVELETLTPGNYAVQVVPDLTQWTSASRFFGVDNGSDSRPSANLSLTVGDRRFEPSPDGLITHGVDLGREPSPLMEAVLSGPPLWSFRSRWDDGRKRPLSTVELDDSGHAWLEPLAASLSPMAARTHLGSLLLSGDEVGAVELRHERRQSVNAIAARLRALVRKRSSSALALSGQYQLLRDTWIGPVMETLGYGYREPEAAILDSMPQACAALALLSSERDAQGRVRRSIERALVLVESSWQPDSLLGAAERDFAERLCVSWNVESAIITDGLRWFLHHRRSRMPLAAMNLQSVAQSADLFALNDFIDRFANHATVGG